MIDTNAMGSEFNVKETDFTNQRFLPFIFAPGANNFHNEDTRAKVMPKRVM